MVFVNLVRESVGVWVGSSRLGVSSVVSLLGWLVVAPLCLYGGLNFFGFFEQTQAPFPSGLTLDDFVLTAARIVSLLFLLALLLQLSLPTSTDNLSWLQKLASCFPMFLGWAVLVGLADQGLLSLAVWSVRQQFLAGFSAYAFYSVWFGLLVFVSRWVLRILWPKDAKQSRVSSFGVLVLSLFVALMCLGAVVWILNNWYVSVDAMPFSLVSAGRSFLLPFWEESHGSGLWSAFVLGAAVKAVVVLVVVSFWRSELEVDEIR